MSQNLYPHMMHMRVCPWPCVRVKRACAFASFSFPTGGCFLFSFASNCSSNAPPISTILGTCKPSGSSNRSAKNMHAC